MEPLVIFGVACNVLQVIGSVEQAVKLGRTIYKSGTVDPELARTTDDLDQCLHSLTSSLEGSKEPISEDTKELLAVARQCLAAGAEVKKELDKIADKASKGSRLGTFRGVLATTFGGGARLKRVENTMHNRQRVLEDRLLVHICTKVEAAVLQGQNNFSSLDSTLQAFVMACTQGQCTLEQLRRNQIDQSDSVKAHVTAEGERFRQVTGRDIEESSNRVGDRISTDLKLAQLTEASRKEYEKLLDSLHYSKMDYRRNQINDAHPTTFNWIFRSIHNGSDTPPNIARNGEPPLYEEGSDNDPHIERDSFVQWLVQGKSSKPYWISGKPGSGKSTLIKFLMKHTLTRKVLTSVEGQDAAILSHFFWEAGDGRQHNIIGFLSSLLHQLLVEKTFLCNDILHKFSYAGRKKEINDWSEHELEAVLVHSLSIAQIGFCVFVDALDEAKDQLTLLELLKRLCSLPRIRLCLSSRSEPVFQKILGDCPVLLMQDVNYKDIRTFTHDKLAKSSLYATVAQDKLLEVLCRLAEGVFLWVALAIKSLEMGAYYEENFDELLGRLVALPTDLEELFAKMWNREHVKNPTHQKSAARYLNIMLEYERGVPDGHTMTVRLMTLIANPALATALIHDLNESLMKQFDDASAEVFRHLHLRTAGLLEVKQDCTVSFVHQSAYGFLSDSARGLEILHLGSSPLKDWMKRLFTGLIAHQEIRTNASFSPNETIIRDTASSAANRGHLSSISRRSDQEPSENYYYSSKYVDIDCTSMLCLIAEFFEDDNISAHDVHDLLLLAQTVYSRGRWKWCRQKSWNGLFGLGPDMPSRNVVPHFLGVAAFTGFFPFVVDLMKNLYDTAPVGMKLSSRYEDHIIIASIIGIDSVPSLPAEVMRLIQLLSHNAMPSPLTNFNTTVASLWQSYRLQMNNRLLFNFKKDVENSEEYGDYINSCLIGLLQANYSRADTFLFRLQHRNQSDPRDHFTMHWITNLHMDLIESTHRVEEDQLRNDPRFAEEFSRKDPHLDYAVYIQIDAKTMLSLFLAPESDTRVEDDALFSHLSAAVEALPMPFLMRIVGYVPVQDLNGERGQENQCRLPINNDASGNISDNGKSFEFSDIGSFRRANNLYSRSTRYHVILGLEQYIEEILPNMPQGTIWELENHLIQIGLLDGKEVDAEWPPPHYVSIALEEARAKHVTNKTGCADN